MVVNEYRFYELDLEKLKAVKEMERKHAKENIKEDDLFNNQKK